jgi:serine/threonine protein kinase/Tol biopolymer transport system component
MPLISGTRLGPYEITARVGVGGMGEVYKAFDTRLERTVAIKVLPPRLTQDGQAQQRFAREARVVAGLSHPHICPLFDIGQYDGTDFLVMEYLEGETLATRLARGRLPLEQALRYAIEMAEALAAAHAAGIVHRDLKPANVILTKSGAMLLDFGIAKPRPEIVARSGGTTTEQPITRDGAMPGTLQYMAPEQMEGLDADARSDIFAFGTVLYEMIAGRKAFEARTEAALVGKILESEPPPLSNGNAPLPPALEFLVRTCLAKSPDARWRSASDILLGLKWIDQERSTASAAMPVSGGTSTRGWWYAIVAALLTLLAVSVVVLLRPSDSTTSRPRARFDIALPDRLGFDWPDWPIVSPDGQRLAFTARSEGRRQLWVRHLDGSVTPLPDTEGAAFAFWSPDSRTIAFFAGGKLKKVDATGGPITMLTDSFSVSRGTWGVDGTILFVPRPNGPIHAVADTGGASRPVTTLNTSRGETSHQVAKFLPDRRHFLYSASGQQPGIYAASLDGGVTREVLRGVTTATFAPPGYLLFNRQQTLMAQRFDPATLEPQGAVFPIADQIAGGAFSASDEGTLVYRAGGTSATELVWITREGRRAGVVGAPAYYQQIALSPSGRRAAVQRIDTDTGNPDLWVVDVATGISSRLTLDPAMDADPAWSPDERRLAFTTFRTGRATAFLFDLVSGKEQPLFDMLPAQQPFARQDASSLTSLAPARIPEGIAVDDWTADGNTLVVRTFGRAVFAVPAQAPRTPTLLVDTPYVEDQMQVSADGRLIAFNSDESGRWEVYIATFPAFTQKRQVSSVGGMQPRWRRDGRELFYLAADGTMMAASVSMAGQPTSGLPEQLFQTHLSPSPNVPQYDVSADGSRFLVLEPARAGGEPITFVLNWAAELIR